jgi:hypothetical protein
MGPVIGRRAELGFLALVILVSCSGGKGGSDGGGPPPHGWMVGQGGSGDSGTVSKILQSDSRRVPDRGTPTRRTLTTFL